MGVHMVGARVGELVGEAQLIDNWEGFPADVAQLVHAHPTQNEALGEAHLPWPGSHSTPTPDGKTTTSDRTTADTLGRRRPPRNAMAELVTIPALGESVTEGTVTRWLKNVGDHRRGRRAAA